MTSTNTLYVKKLSANAVLPVKGNNTDAGCDLSAANNYTVPARGHLLIATDIAIAIPYGTYGRVAPRSGLALKYGIDVGAGVLDFGYRGPVGVILFNHTDKDFVVNHKDRIAQLILERIVPDADVVEVEQLDDTARGSNGFGSTGIKSKE